MPAIRPIDYRRLVKVFEREGFLFNRQKGDHLIFTKSGVKRPLVIPMYDEVPPTLRPHSTPKLTSNNSRTR